ncbi:hypothetical protein QQF64_006423 [Cirrhinus molitorella]|uniref:Uncharacterized protein n=2 Tax=Cirrhinus molitorella TaxID=172907 RepID=A0AA88PPD9_9TELE|nr:hypothetical protein Q8A67_010718 [Cirrhinus molitorella]
MSTDSEIERKIYDFFRRNGKSKALIISKEFGLDKRTVNKHLYTLESSKQLFRTDEDPPIWDLVEKKIEPKLSRKPEQRSRMTTETVEEKHVEDLLRSGGLKSREIARDLGESRQTISRHLYSLEKKDKVRKCSISEVWTLNEEWSDTSFSQQSSSSCSSDHGLDLISGLHHFEVIAKLGQGSYGCVYKVKHRYDHKIYAVKRVILTRKADSEVMALADLDHPNIVRYITCWPGSDNWTPNQEKKQVSDAPDSSSDAVTFERDGCGEKDDDEDDDITSEMESLAVTDSKTYLFIQMEFCQGGTLTDWIKARNLMEKQRTIVEIHKVFYEIITGVEYIHSNKLIHRDLKPDNILFSADGKVKIGDFGLVVTQKDQNGDPIERSNRGTLTYMSPEQENKRYYDEKTDIFPLGLIWFEMIWKISTGMERAELWPNLRNKRFPNRFSDTHPTESKFIMEMLSCSPEHRPNAKSVKEKLDRFFSLDQDLLSQKTV